MARSGPVLSSRVVEAGSPVPASRSSADRPAFRGDVEGLRAVAVGLVFLFHADVPLVGAGGLIGVDVFFVISGFVITGLLVREIERTGRIALADFYARRARRILPSAAFVVLVVLGVTALTGTAAEKDHTGEDALATSLQVTNWHFLSFDLDRLAPRADESPLLHYWSLAVEEQFYIVWPLLMIAALALARRRGLSWKRALVIGSVGLSAASLALSVVLTYQHNLTGYLASPTRFFEFGAGALLAIGATRTARWATAARGPAAGNVLGWAGVVLVVLGLALTPRFPFPGFIALLPALGGAALILAGGLTTGRWSVPWLLGLPPVRFLGRISYVWYLWHVPLTAWAVQVAGRSEWWFVLAVELVAVVPAYLTSVLVERPFRHAPVFAASPARGLALGGVLTLVVAAAAGALIAF